jgi:hypothetical protein
MGGDAVRLRPARGRGRARRLARRARDLTARQSHVRGRLMPASASARRSSCRCWPWSLGSRPPCCLRDCRQTCCPRSCRRTSRRASGAVRRGHGPLPRRQTIHESHVAGQVPDTLRPRQTLVIQRVNHVAVAHPPASEAARTADDVRWCSLERSGRRARRYARARCADA